MSNTISKHGMRGLVLAALAAAACGDDTTTTTTTGSGGEGGSAPTSTGIGGSADGGGTPSSTGNGSGADTVTSPSSTGQGGDGGAGDGGSTSEGGSTSDGGGGSGPAECDDAGDCDDQSICTDDSCDAGDCVNEPLANGPAPGGDDPGDCVDLVCTNGAVGTVADDSEDPPDANPPCQLTICLGGVPTPDFADVGTSCGADPLECDGLGNCEGCAGTPGECGAATVCSAPICDLITETCDPGFTTVDPADPVDGDCSALDCPGDSSQPNTVIDDTDLPADLPCSDRGCSIGTPTTPISGLGTACIGQVGVCDGLGSAAANCKTCVDSANGNGTDAGCGGGTPICDIGGNSGTGLCHAPNTFDPNYSLPGVTYSDGNLSASGNSATTKNIRTVVGRSSGRFYWEITATGGDGTTNAGGLGILEAASPNNSPWIGNQPSGLSFGYGSCCYATYWTNWAGVTTSGVPPLGSAVSNGIVYMFALDRTTGRFWAGQNGVWYNGGDPSTTLNPAATGISGTVYAGVTFYPSSINSFTANFGGSPMIYTVPTGYARGLY